MECVPVNLSIGEFTIFCTSTTILEQVLFKLQDGSSFALFHAELVLGQKFVAIVVSSYVVNGYITL